MLLRDSLPKCMQRIYSIFIFKLLLLFILAKPVFGVELEAGSSAASKIHQKAEDERIIKLHSFLDKHNSPLAPYAAVFIEKADEYHMPDWKLVPAITGVESTFGKQIPAESYNAYGWVNGKYAFKSWEDSIDVVTKTLKEKYINRGLTTPETMSPVYAPPSTTWAGKVRFFMNQIDLSVVSKVDSLAFTL